MKRTNKTVKILTVHYHDEHAEFMGDLESYNVNAWRKVYLTPVGQEVVKYNFAWYLVPKNKSEFDISNNMVFSASEGL